MFSLSSFHTYILYRHPTDMRKGFDGLSGIVLSVLKTDPCNGTVYLFINKRRDKLKLLVWEQNGFTLYYKRLEQGTFELPDFKSEGMALNWSQLVLMVSGISLKKLSYRKRFTPDHPLKLMHKFNG